MCWHGICLYGNFDMGVAYEQHGTPFNSMAGGPLNYVVEKASNGSYFGVGANKMSTSFIGLRGKQEVADNLYAVFNLQTLFNPASGADVNQIGGIVQNNGLGANVNTLQWANSYGDFVEGRRVVQQRGLFRYQFADLRYVHHGPSERADFGPRRQL